MLVLLIFRLCSQVNVAMPPIHAMDMGMGKPSLGLLSGQCL